MLKTFNHQLRIDELEKENARLSYENLVLKQDREHLYERAKKFDLENMHLKKKVDYLESCDYPKFEKGTTMLKTDKRKSSYQCRDCIHHDICKYEDDFKNLVKSIIDHAIDASDGMNVNYNVDITCPKYQAVSYVARGSSRIQDELCKRFVG